MGRYSPQPPPYGLLARDPIGEGLLRGLTTVSGIRDRSRRTDILDRAQKSRSRYEEALSQWREGETLDSSIQRARGGYRPESEDYDAGLAPARPGHEPVPRSVTMPTDVETSGFARGPGPRAADATMATVQPTPGVDPYMEQQPAQAPSFEPGKSYSIPGDLNPRIRLPGGGSVPYEDPRIVELEEMIQSSLRETTGRDMPGTAGAMARGGISGPMYPPERKPYEWKPSTYEEWQAATQFEEDVKGPDATDRSHAREDMENRAETYAASLITSGVDPAEAVDRAARQYGVVPDPAAVQRVTQEAFQRLDRVYGRIGYPENNWQADAIWQIVVQGKSVDDALSYYQRASEGGDLAIQDPATGRTRQLSPQEVESIRSYVTKYGNEPDPWAELMNRIPQRPTE